MKAAATTITQRMCHESGAIRVPDHAKKQLMHWVRQHILLVGFCASLLGVGIPYWMIPYHGVNLPNSLYGVPLLIVGAAAALSCAFSASSYGRAVAIVGASVPVAVVLRIAVETTADPTSHNLWPIEVVIALILGFACSGVGAIAGSLARKLIPRAHHGE